MKERRGIGVIPSHEPRARIRFACGTPRELKDTVSNLSDSKKPHRDPGLSGHWL